MGLDLEKIETITMEEALNRYPRQWIGVIVINRDRESGQPKDIKVIAKNVDINVIRRSLKAEEYCTFYTGPIPESTLVLMF